jgi:hypothetical protein
MKRTRPIRVRLDEEEFRILQLVARELGVTMSDVVRQLIRNADLVVQSVLMRMKKGERVVTPAITAITVDKARRTAWVIAAIRSQQTRNS